MTTTKHTALAGAIIALLVASPAHAQSDSPGPLDHKVNYSPYPAKNFPNRAYFGDTHLHTSYSTDAGLVGTKVGPEEAYRFARGETVTSNSGQPVRLGRPLDFLVIADHAENLGLAPMIAESDPVLLSHPWGKKVHDMAKKGTFDGMREAFDTWIEAMQKVEDPFKGKEAEMAGPPWRRLTALAEKYNEPGRFTAIIGYEWTSGPQGAKLAAMRDALHLLISAVLTGAMPARHCKACGVSASGFNAMSSPNSRGASFGPAPGSEVKRA